MTKTVTMNYVKAKAYKITKNFKAIELNDFLTDIKIDSVIIEQNPLVVFMTFEGRLQTAYIGDFIVVIDDMPIVFTLKQMRALLKTGKEE